MSLRIRGRLVPAEIRPIRSGFFLRAAIHAMFGLKAGSIVDANGAACVVKYLSAGEPTEYETWAILMPVRKEMQNAAVSFSA